MIYKNRSLNILLAVDNNTIVEYFNSIFIDYNIDNFFDLRNSDNIKNLNNTDVKKYVLGVIDDFDFYKKNIENQLDIENIIYITEEDSKIIKKDNIFIIEKPISLSNLLSKAEKILDDKEKIIEFEGFKIFNDILYFKDYQEKIGEKELEVLKYLYTNKDSSKQDLLNDIWGYDDDIDTKVLENTINKIKSKLKVLNIDEFIVLKDKKYSINNKYIKSKQ